MNMHCAVHDCPYEERRGMTNGLHAPHCKWDGSLHPDVFMEWLEKPGTVLTPTDKNYKVYIAVESDEDPDALRVTTAGSGEIPAQYADRAVRPNRRQRKMMREQGMSFSADQKDVWVIFSKRGARREDKFYFEHLSEEQRSRFCELLNGGKLSLEYPGYFYRLPFFLRR